MPTESSDMTETVTATDKDLIILYRTFSQEMWCAGWLADPEAMRDEFILWLREKYASAPNRVDEWDACSYEIEALPALRDMFTDALGLRIEAIEAEKPTAAGVEISADRVTAYLSDGRAISAPLAWYPRLAHAAPEERSSWELCGGGWRIHWPDLDEEISVEGMLAGQAFGGSQQSFREWLESIKAGHGLEVFEQRQANEKRVKSGIGSDL